ncbi:hypothetical protein NDU88_010381 [Pleurodeles waltl]|uniref:Uncharacterized protein n=1 Tax=Pleurodeles waltl TaxID=8319 RepID=A0AAV7RZ50_PLEWA|nr:hypothetical protein NDU88_010381 [Pleurodeles waltl]
MPRTPLDGSTPMDTGPYAHTTARGTYCPSGPSPVLQSLLPACAGVPAAASQVLCRSGKHHPGVPATEQEQQ